MGTHLKGRGDNRRWVDLQLPLYRLLLPHLPLPSDVTLPADPERSDLVEVGYIVLPKDLEASGWIPAGFSPSDVQEAWERAAAVAEELRSGTVRFDRTRADRSLRDDDPFRPLLGLTGLPRDPTSPPEGSDDERESGAS